MTATVYDAGALIAADRNDREFWADHRVRLEADVLPAVAAPVVAQVSRAPHQAQLRRLLRGCEVVAMTESDAHAAGALLGKAGASDVIDAVVVHLAVTRAADIVTSDRRDLRALLVAARSRLRLIDV